MVGMRWSGRKNSGWVTTGKVTVGRERMAGSAAVVYMCTLEHTQIPNRSTSIATHNISESS